MLVLYITSRVYCVILLQISYVFMEQPPTPFFGEFNGTRVMTSFRAPLTLIVYYLVYPGWAQASPPIFRHKTLKVQ